jgi:hypothetical protein
MKTVAVSIPLLLCACTQTAEPVSHLEKRSLGVECYYGQTSSGRVPLSKIVHELRAVERGDTVHVAVIFNREFVDNTYGVNAIGWGERGHTFKDLTGSDHVELGLWSRGGAETFRSKVDYLTALDRDQSGFGSLGIGGGDGKLLVGDASAVVAWGSSLDANFNAAGYALTDSSPETDDSYTPNPQYPNWNFWVEYRLQVLLSAFGTSGFGAARMEFVHASPSKLGTNTVEVVQDDCPIDGEPDPFPDCERASPETDCNLVPDTDGDGTPDTVDSDDDDDGIPDNVDGDANGDDVPDLADTDGDGIPNDRDPDDDGDGTPDELDGDDNGDGILDSADTDGDGIPDASDPDDDNDGVIDPVDGDDDGDGLPDLVDTDGDGIPDASDPDDDNDGVIDPVDGGGLDAPEQCTADEDCALGESCLGGQCVSV